MIKKILFKEILSCIPHRPPILLIESVKVDVDNLSGYGVYNHSLKPKNIKNSYLDSRVVPLAYLLEGVFQTAGVLRNQLKAYPNSKKKLLTTLPYVKYEGKIEWGEDILFEVTFLRVGSMFDKFRGEIWKDSERVFVCEAISGGEKFG